MIKTLMHSDFSVKRKLPLNYAQIEGNKENYIHQEEYIQPCYLCELTNAYVSPYGIVFKNGRVVKESVYSMFTKNTNEITFYKKIVLGKTRRISGECLVAHNAYYDNYYHWTLEALPRIFSIKEQTSSLKLLIHEKLKPFIEVYLSYFNFKDIITVKDDELILAEKLWLPMHTAPGLSHNEALVNNLSDYIKSKTPYGEPELKEYKKIFISRKKATYRRAVNEDAAFDVLKDFGFQKVALEDMKLHEQINLLRNVKVFSGVHGAGFSNLMYMDDGQLLIDIIHENHPQSAFYNLACAFNINYLRLGCEGAGVQKYCGSDDIKVDIKKLENLLSIYQC